MKFKKPKSISYMLNEVIQYKFKIEGNASSKNMVVSEYEQQALIERLSLNISDENLFFVVNAEDLKLTLANGFEVLGYNSKEFTSTIHCMEKIAMAGFIDLILMYQRRLLDFFKMVNNSIKFDCPGFAVQFPVVKANGQIVLMKCTVKVFQFSEEKVISHLIYQMTIIKTNYNNEPLEPRLINTMNESTIMLKDLFSKGFIWESSPFSPKEILIMKAYANNLELKMNDLAISMNTTFETLKGYNKQIIIKAKAYLGPLFTLNNAKDIAIFFRHCGVI